MIHARKPMAVGAILLASLFVVDTTNGEDAKPKRPNQYEFETIVIPGAAADEPTLPKFSLERAADYVEQGNLAWWKKRNCVACHTSGTYLLMRPALTPHFGKPSPDMRDLYVKAFKKYEGKNQKQRLRSVGPTQMAYIAGGLAEWDAHVTGKLSPETDQALKLMFEVQGEEGSWGNATCWPPFESSDYQGATVAAMAAATAPGWLSNQTDEPLLKKIERMKDYLRTSPPHDYGRLLLLWTSTRLPGLLDEQQKEELIAKVWKHQQDDGGWSIRTFAAPEEWGGGNRAGKLRAEPEFKNPPSDGHQTGLAILVLRDAGVSAKDERIVRGVKWLLENQRESGRWWTRSLNTDKFHFITFSGTCYPLIALSKCAQLPKIQPTTTASKADAVENGPLGLNILLTP